MLLAGSMTDAATVVVISVTCRGGASSLKLELKTQPKVKTLLLCDLLGFGF